MNKTFKNEFDKFLKKLKDKENFAFARFSDGELFILQNKKVVLAENHYVTGDIKGPNKYTKEEQKEFDPQIHQFYREKLIECFKYKKENYFKGICTSSDAHVGSESFQYQVKLHGGDHESLTYSNLLINSNYKRFVEDMLPVIAEREIIYVVNELADTTRLPFNIKKKFIIGSNCMINDYKVIDEVKNYIKENDISNHIILCSAASLSNYIIHDCFKENNNNTFIDIGSCLNPLLNLEGWVYTRGYLTDYWLGQKNHFGSQVDVWN